MINYRTSNITKRSYANGYIRSTDQITIAETNSLRGIISATARSCVEPCDVTLLKKQLTGTATIGDVDPIQMCAAPLTRAQIANGDKRLESSLDRN